MIIMMPHQVALALLEPRPDEASAGLPGHRRVPQRPWPQGREALLVEVLDLDAGPDHAGHAFIIIILCHVHVYNCILICMCIYIYIYMYIHIHYICCLYVTIALQDMELLPPLEDKPVEDSHVYDKT